MNKEKVIEIISRKYIRDYVTNLQYTVGYNSALDDVQEIIKSVPAETLVRQGEVPPMQTADSLEQKIKEFADIYGLECPSSSNCGNGGTLSEHGCNGTEEDCAATCPVPVQCELCYTEPRSKFNLINDLKEIIGGLSA